MNLSDEQPQLPPVQSQQQNDDGQTTQIPTVQSIPNDNSTNQQSSLTDLPASASDEDLIEKEWVDKAKEIVDNTVGDPHAQSEQLGKMKSDYIRKRYGKDIKI